MGCCGDDEKGDPGEDIAMTDGNDSTEGKYGKPREYDDNFRGPIQNRGCTDIICCFVFIVFILGLVVVAFFAYYYGDPKLLLYASNSEKELCGIGKNKDKPYLYFFNLLACLKGGGLTTFITGCPTPQICVSECPTQYKALYLPGATSQCDSNFCTKEGTDQACDKRIRDEQCPPFLIKSTPLLNRCIPGEELIDKATTIYDRAVLNRCMPGEELIDKATTIYDRAGDAINSTQSDSFINTGAVFKQFLKVQQLTSKVISDVVVTWWLIVIAYVIASVVSFIWIVLMRWIACPVVYATIFFFLAIFGFGVIWSFMNYIKTKDTDETFYLYLVVTTFTFSRSSFWLSLGIVALIVFIIIFLIMIFLRKRIQLAVNLISESSKAVGSMMLTLLWPIIPFILQLGTIALWITIAVYLASVGRGKAQMNATSSGDNPFEKLDCKNSRNIAPLKGNDTLGEICGFLKYGTDKYTFYLQIYNLFMFFWLLNFVVAVGQMTLAGAFASYYWAMEKPRDIPSLPIASSFFRCFRYHLGTLAFGSLLIAIVSIIKVILEYFYEKSKKTENKVAQFLLKCCICCFWCLEKFLQFLNKNAYIMCAIYGKNFCVSAKNAFSLIMRNIVRVVVVDKVTDFLLLIGKLVVTGGVTCGAFFYFDRRIPWLSETTPQLNYYLAPVIIICVGTYVIASCFFSVYAMAVDTLFLCFLEDLERNDGSPEKPYYMNKSLLKILNKKQKTPKAE